VTGEVTSQLVLSLAAVTILLSSVEALVGYRAFLIVGFGSYARSSSVIWSIARSVYVGRFVCAAALLVSMALDAPGPVTNGFMIAVAALLVFSIHFHGFGQDGAESVSMIVFVAAVLALFAGKHGDVLFLIFCTAQHCVVFATAGLGKCFGSSWGSGEPMRRIFQNPAYSARWARPFVLNSRRGRMNAERCLIALQLALAIAWLLPPPVAAVVLCGGLAFHVVTAFANGIYKFVWSFAALDIAAFWASTSIWGAL
jgi:hypothetical protein